MTRALPSLVVPLVLASTASTHAQDAPCPTEGMRYDVALATGAVRVAVCVPGTGADTVSFSLPRFGGVETFADNVVSIGAMSAEHAPLPVARREDGRFVVAADGMPFRVSYEIRHQKPSFMGTADGGQFQPTLFDRWAFLWGHAWAMRPGDDALASRPVGVRVDAGPYGAAFPSWGADSVLADVDALRNTALAAGDFRRVVRDVDGVPVTFLAVGDWTFTDAAFADAVQRILQVQAEAMGSYPARRLSVILLPGLPNSAGGTVVREAMVVYPRPDADVARDVGTLGLVAHEHFHLWNGEAAVSASGIPEGELKWFSEGFTDYYADLTLLRAGVLDDAAFIERINARLREYAANPHARTATSAVLGERYWASRDYNRLPYVKGALVAWMVDLRIRRATGGARTLDDVMRAVVARGAPYGPDDLVRAVEDAAGEPWAAFFDAYVFGAGELPVAAVCREAGMDCGTADEAIFHRGFEIDGPLRAGAAITAVEEGSAAFRAGLRPGDVITRMSMRGEPDARATVSVTRGGAVLEFAYFPARTVTVLRILPTDASLRVVADLRGG